MIKLAIPAAAVAGLVGLAAFHAPAQAQQTRIAEILVYGNDPCPRSTADEVVVCVRLNERERYRIPERLRTGEPRQLREAWANKARAIEVAGRTGIQSCSPVGPGGHTGCLDRAIEQALAEAREAARQATPPEE